MRAIINTVKHYVQRSNLAIASGAAASTIVAAAVSNTALPSATHHVKEGSVVKAIYLEYWLKGTGASDADTQFNLVFFKNPGGANDMSVSDSLNLMAYDNKKNIFFSSQGVIGGVGGGQSIPVVRQWFKIPKGKQRMGLNDELTVFVGSTGESVQLCGQAIYKEMQ